MAADRGLRGAGRLPASGKSRDFGLAHALFALSYGAALWWFPAMSPVTFVAHARGFEDPTGGALTELTAQRRMMLEYELRIASQSASTDYRERARKEAQSLKQREIFYERLDALEGTTNAIGIAGIGLLGVALAVGLRAPRREPPGGDPIGHHAEQPHPLDAGL